MREQIIFTMSEPTPPTDTRPVVENGSSAPRGEHTMSRAVAKPVSRGLAGWARSGASEAMIASAVHNTATDAARVEDVRAALDRVPPAPLQPFRPDAASQPNGHGNGHTAEGAAPATAAGGGRTGEPPGIEPPVPSAPEPESNGHHDIPPVPVQGSMEAGTPERPGVQATTPEEQQRPKTADELYNELPEEWREKVKAAGGESAVKKLVDLSLRGELTPEQDQERTAALADLKKMIEENPELADETRLAFQRMGLNMDELLEKHDEEEATTAEEKAALEAEGRGMIQKLKNLFSRKKDKESEEEAKKTMDEISNSGFIERIRKKHKVLYFLLITTMITVALYFGLVGSVSSGIAGKR